MPTLLFTDINVQVVNFMYCIHIFQNSRVSAFRTSANHRQQGSQVNSFFLDNLPFYKKEKKLKRVNDQGKKVSILWTVTDFLFSFFTITCNRLKCWYCWTFLAFGTTHCYFLSLISVHYKDPEYDEDHLFESVVLKGAE